MPQLHIYDRRERRLVRLADALLAPATLLRRHGPIAPPRSILVLRLERIGDLLMTLPALGELRALAPEATIDLAVGSWNADVARSIRGINHVEVADAAWLARGTDGASLGTLLSAARGWRQRQYDLVVNFEPDIRSNLIAAAAGGRRRAGFTTGGGGPLLDVALPHDPTRHTADNAVDLVHAIFGRTAAGESAPLDLPAAVRADAARMLGSARRPLVAMHVSGGRAVKQWPEERFAEVAQQLVVDRDATIVLTGAPADRQQVEIVKSSLPEEHVIDVTGVDLLHVAALLDRVDVLVTGDTGPMHLAYAVGTPVVAIFGPSDPVRYGPRGAIPHVVRVDLPCSPCNRIRLPPERCRGGTPDCLTGVTTAAVLAAVDDVLVRSRPAERPLQSLV